MKKCTKAYNKREALLRHRQAKHPYTNLISARRPLKAPLKAYERGMTPQQRFVSDISQERMEYAVLKSFTGSQHFKASLRRLAANPLSDWCEFQSKLKEERKTMRSSFQKYLSTAGVFTALQNLSTKSGQQDGDEGESQVGESLTSAHKSSILSFNCLA